MAQLVIHEPGQSPSALTLTKALSVGRDSQCDLTLVHHQVSRQHARFEWDETGWILRDLGSSNRTFVNGVRIEQAKLENGDLIDIGPVRIVFQNHHATEIVAVKPSQYGATLEVGPPNKRLELLYEMIRAVGVIDNLDTLLQRMLDGVLRLVGGERAMIVLVNKQRREILRRFVHSRSKGDDKDIVVDRTMTDAMLNRHEAVIVRGGGRSEGSVAFDEQASLSAMGAPLELGGRTLGFLYVDDRSHGDCFGPEDLDFLAALTSLTVVAIDNAERFSRVASIADAGIGIGPVTEILGQCPEVHSMRKLIAKTAASATASVLIQGESGTGKELAARAIHAASPRARRQFVAINCAAIPETMIESVLFGHEKGAFSGATQRKRGYFELADQGTLFLDGIDDLSLAAQAKVLRAVQHGEIQPLGAELPIYVDVRIISATHADLRREIAEGRFREDLFYRIRVLEIDVPPLRERGNDIALLAQTFLESGALNLDKRLRGFSKAAMTALAAYAWPGNVRELRNEVERALLLAEGSVVELEDLSLEIARPWLDSKPSQEPVDSLSARFASLDTTERALVEEALAVSQGNMTEAARLLGITRIMMRRRVERYGIRCQSE